MDLYPVATCYNARQDNTIQYNNTPSHIITYNIQRKITKKKSRTRTVHY